MGAESVADVNVEAVASIDGAEVAVKLEAPHRHCIEDLSEFRVASKRVSASLTLCSPVH
jgi:hypothetical protein